MLNCSLSFAETSVENILLFMHSGEERVLNWEERLQIALDISHGIEYLHEGVFVMI